MSANDRLVIFPSRANQVFIKQKIIAATKGLSLLKRKRDALELKLREIASDLAKCQSELEEMMQAAIFSMARANYFGTDFKPASIMASERADVFLRTRTRKVVGLSLPEFQLIIRSLSSYPYTGLARGGAQVEIVRKKFQEALETLIKLSSLQYSVKVLKEGVRQNNMRINGLDYVLLPKFNNTSLYIRNELEEFEREDFYRLKCSQAKQRKLKQKFKQLIKEKDEEAQRTGSINIGGAIDEKFDMDIFERATGSQ